MKLLWYKGDLKNECYKFFEIFITIKVLLSSSKGKNMLLNEREAFWRQCAFDE